MKKHGKSHLIEVRSYSHLKLKIIQQISDEMDKAG